MILNLGMAMMNRSSTMRSIAVTPVTITKFICACVCHTLMMDHVQIHGANSIILSIIVDVIWTCCMSLVARVIREDVWNLLISALEKDMTLSKSLDLRSLPIVAPTRAARNEMPVVNTRTISDMRSIIPPHFHIYLFCTVRMSMPASSSHSAAYWRPIDLRFWSDSSRSDGSFSPILSAYLFATGTVSSSSSSFSLSASVSFSLYIPSSSAS